MSLKRLLSVIVLAFALGIAVSVVSDATAGVGIADEPCPTVAGEHTNTCPAGTVGVPYSIRFKEAEGSGCGEGKQKFTVDSGVFPPGLTLASSGVVSGTPTQAGSFTFYVKIAEPVGQPGCAGSVGEKRFTIPINPAVPKLTIGPESTAPGTVGTPYSLAMTANLSDPKTWSIAAGALPPGLAIGASDGVISGTPTAAGSYPFTVRAVIDAQRSDTKALTIEIRDPLAIAAPSPLAAAGAVTRWEVGVPLRVSLTATGGTGTYTWALAGGVLPQGVAFAADGSIAGSPQLPGKFGFAVAVSDTEGRTAVYVGRLVIAPRLAVLPRPLRQGRVGRLYRGKLLATGGVVPRTWRVMRGPLPQGVRFDPELGVLAGTPRKAGRYRVTFQVVDALGVKSTKTFLIKVAAVPAKKKKR